MDGAGRRIISSGVGGMLGGATTGAILGVPELGIGALPGAILGGTAGLSLGLLKGIVVEGVGLGQKLEDIDINKINH